ncbi:MULTISPECIES: M1 family metallopeptidase [unclassified Nocardioides]|uniref:M1 family metallopeptidase n=1 Tax=unclassified Nocardioides TaxID=2615069 RepID=UPI0007037DEA|nr:MULTISPECIES: M1 family metallopeptidase [unclassified Nocardioides]KRC56615.1 aminopeptidase [Nocardioides sp. Root79]KRC76827.1 aminopeptidase [Nocardioides sp. Root240]
MTTSITDPHSRSRPNEVVVRHLGLDLDVDFATRTVSGSATLDLEHLAADATRLVLDTWQLDIASVKGADGADLPFELGTPDPVLGSALTIEVGAADRVVVHYATSPEARAMQWLEPQQTASGKPFLFTQAQPILARTWIPCQDSPGVRTTYDATVRVPADLLALMSAENPVERSADGSYRFSMPQPVPSYLVALAVGDLEFRPLGDRSGVYAEPSVVDGAAWEFADTEPMIAAAERLYGPYRWGRYDILVLPPSFPYGGMENPRLTFATPTILAGDRSLVTLIAHELAHSWSGNLVTNATWNDIWLNEGFTVYFETRIDEEMYGEAYTHMLLRLGRQDLDRAVADEVPRDTWLELDMSSRDPDDGPTKIPYEKGSLFLRLIEAKVGRERFDAFLRAYFDRFAFGSMDTATFLAYLSSELLDPAGVTFDDLQLEAWVHGPGVPSNAPEFASDAFDRVDAQAAALVAGGDVAALDTDGWVSQQWVHFVRALPESVGFPTLAAVDAQFGFSTSGNIEIATAWLELAVASGYVNASPAVDRALADFLTRHGRALYIRRVYERLAATEQGRQRAREIYATARASYHPVSQGVIDRILG